jgi:diaminohydroxyphosphoribosylaminopyrimidine deaminase/5-amino-6-(5-phosphoribosylamino)uracil reductase
MHDPNIHVAGCGFSMLQARGIKVIKGVMEKQAQYLNRIYLKNITGNRPFVIMKAGISLDGRIALKNGVSKWITGPESLEHAQGLRKQCDAILAGINTVLVDAPFLDCRTDKSKKIKKVILDSRGRTPLKANIFKYSDPQDVFICAPNISRVRLRQFEKKGVNVIREKTLKGLLRELYSSGITSVLVEGGSGVITAFLKERLIDEAYFYIAPLIIGNDGIPFAQNLGFTKLDKTYKIVDAKREILGKDVLIKGPVSY